jgi:hypothetical protein
LAVVFCGRGSHVEWCTSAAACASDGNDAYPDTGTNPKYPPAGGRTDAGTEDVGAGVGAEDVADGVGVGVGEVVGRGEVVGVGVRFCGALAVTALLPAFAAVSCEVVDKGVQAAVATSAVRATPANSPVP